MEQVKKSSKPAHPALSKIYQKVDEVLNTFESPAAAWVNYIILFFVFLSTSSFILGTIPQFDPWQSYFDQVEAITIIFFTVEYVLRLWVAPKPKYKYVFSLFAIIDLLSILPFYISIVPLSFFKTIRSLRIIRIFRVLRLAKVSRQLSTKLTDAEKKASATKVEFQILGITAFIIVLVFSAIMYSIENPAGTSGFGNIFSAMWYVIVTITTVGYGDVVPATILGKITATMIMFCGIGFLGTMTSIIGKAMLAKLAVNTDVIEGKNEDAEDNMAKLADGLYCENWRCRDTKHLAGSMFCKTCGTKFSFKPKSKKKK